MEAEGKASMDQNRPWRFRMCTGVAIVAFGYAILAANVFPRVKFMHFGMPCMYYDMPNDVYEHGWPTPYMSREHVADYDMGGVFYPPWPFGRLWPFMSSFGNPPLIQFNASALVLDVLVAVSLLSLSVYSIHSSCAAGASSAGQPTSVTGIYGTYLHLPGVLADL